MKKIFKISLSTLLLLGFLLSPFINASAATILSGDNTLVTSSADTGSGLPADTSLQLRLTQDQVKTAQNTYLDSSYNGGTTGGSPSTSFDYASASGNCMGRILGKYLKNLLGGYVQSAMTSAVSTVTSLFAVPIEQAPVSKIGYNQDEQTRRNSAQEVEQNLLKPLAICIGNELVQGMTKSTVKWINNGFKNPDGTTGPAFVSNPKQFFTGIADREIGGLLSEMGLCKPFDLKVRLAILSDYRDSYGYRSQCSLSTIKDSFSGFGSSGDSLEEFFQLTQVPSNNYIGSYLMARNEASNRINYNQDINRLEVTLGNGFLDMKKCVAYKTGTKVCDQWQNTTPGSEVQASLDRALNIQGQSINVANSFDDIVSALVSQLFKLTIGGLQGSI